jgi:ribosomal protein L37E
LAVSPDLACKDCGESEELSGEATESGIRIRCGRCGATWLRDTAVRCATCGGSSVVMRPRAMTQFSRGTQLSIVGWQDVPCCTVCDAEALARSTSSGGPLPSGYRPAAMSPQQ